MKKSLKNLMTGLLILTLCFAAASCDIFPGGNQGGGGNPGGSETTDKPASAFVTIDINPSIELTVSDDGTVVSVYGANEDGQVLLYEEETEIVGKDIEEAIAYITELANELGYLNDENSDVSTSVSADTEAAAEELKNKIDSKIISSAEGIGLAVTINAEDAFALLCELEELKSLYPNNEAIQALTPGKFRLAVSASNGGEVTIEAAAEMSTKDLVEHINKAHKKIGAFATDAYHKAKARAMAIFESSMGVISDGIYTRIYSERASQILANPSYINTIHYGAMYQAYKTSARTYLSVLEIMRFADEYTNYELDDTIVSEIKTALGITDDTPLRDAEGKITLGSVSKFCHKFIDENNVSGEVKDTVREILAEAKDAAELVVMASNAYNTDLESLKNAVQSVITNVSNISSNIAAILPEEAKAEFEECLNDLNATGEKLAEIMENGITSDSIAALAAEAQAKANEILEKIENDLSDEEKSRAEQLLHGYEAQIKALTNDFDGRLAAAEAQAKSHIESKRQERHGKK